MERDPLDMINSADEFVWRAGIEALSADFSEVNCNVLLGLLSDKLWRKRECAAKAVIQWGEKVIPFVLKKIQSKNHDVVYWCLNILGHFSVPQAREKIIELLSSTDHEIRSYAVRAIAMIKAIENAKILFPMLNDPNWAVRKLVFQQLLTFGEIIMDELYSILSQSQKELPHAFIALYVKLGKEKVADKLRNFYQNGSFTTRYSIIVALAEEQGNWVVDLLIIGLSDESLIIKKKSAEILTQMGQKVFERLSVWFGRVDYGTKSQIISIIVDILGERALPIIRRFLTSSDDELRVIAIENLTKIQGDEASNLLISCLKDPKRLVSDYASDCLIKRSKWNLDLILPHLNSDDENMRFLVIKVIGNIGGVALNPIIHILKSGKKEEKLFLLGVLSKVAPNEKLIETLIQLLSNESWPIRYAAANCLQSYGEKSVEAVVKVLNSPSEDVQYWARRILTDMGNTAIHYMKLVLTEGTNLSLIPHIIAALLTMPHPEAVPAVISYLERNDDAQIKSVLEEIGEVTSREVVETILNLLNGSDDRILSWLSYILRKVVKTNLRKIVFLALNHPSDRARGFIIDAIAHWNDLNESDSKVFIRQLEVEKNEKNIKGVVKILGKIPFPSVIDSLKEYLRKCDPDLMLDLMLILASSQDSGFESMLADLLRMRSEVIRIEDVDRVGTILGLIFKNRSEGILQGLTSPNLAFRLCCVVALEQIKENRVAFALMDTLNIKDDPIVVKRAVKILLRYFFSEDFRLKGAVTDYLLNLGKIIVDPINEVLPDIDNDIDRKALIDLAESVGGTISPEALRKKGEKKVIISDSRLDDVLEKRKKALEELEKYDQIIQSSYTQELAIMFTDLKGYTAFSSKASLSEVMGMLKQHDELLIPIIEKNDGKLIKKIGDSFMVIFENPNKSVLAAITIQRRLAEFNCQVSEDRRLAVRIAINFGPVVRRENDVFGDAANLASRLERIAEAEEIIISKYLADVIDQKVFELVDLGEKSFKGLENKPVRVYRVKW